MFKQAYSANVAIFFIGLTVWASFISAGEHDYFGWFIFVLILSVVSRIYIKIYADKNKSANLLNLANYYVLFSFLLGLNFAFITVMYYDLQNHELRNFLTIVNLCLIIAAINTLAVWMRAYIAFSLPQLIGVTAVFILNNSLYGALASAIFLLFMFTIVRNFNSQFKDERLLIEENINLIAKMQMEIFNREEAQIKLENNQQELEKRVKDRTHELEKTNQDLNEQIDKRRIIEKELEYLAYYDELTDLPNRTLFIENLKKALYQAKRNQTLLGVLFIDLDRFKKINDSHGHYVGDNLLKNVSERLKAVLRDSDALARNGGDEFVVLIENMRDAREPYVVANKIIEQLNEKFEIEGHNIHIGASVGISLFPLDGDKALDLLKMADTAMYEAKKIGSNNFQFYSSSMSNQIKDRLKLENALRDALDNNEFYLVYQPQVNILTGKTSGFEALLRWKSPEFGIVSPVQFIPILEDTGLIYSVGDWIILDALNFLKSGKSNNTKVSINLSALQCGIDNYSKKISRYIKSSGVDPKLIEFEITETVLINDFSQTEMFLTDISKLGCTIALDDFGTGYTSFTYLAKLPIDIIKIDRSLVTGIENNKNLQDIVKAIVTMSNSLGIKNIFEGVESEEELNMVKSLNAEVIQGYLFSKPLDLDQIKEWFGNDISAA